MKKGFSILIVTAISILYADNNMATNLKESKDSFTKASTLKQALPSGKKLSISEATIKAINDARSRVQICSKPVNPLAWNKILYTRAKEHSIDMAVTGLLQHNGSGTATDKTAKNLGLNRGSYFYERVNQKADSKSIHSGELIIRSDTQSLKSPKELINYWVQRPQDCKVIMDSKFTDVALSKVISNKDKKSYWTLLLAGRVEPKVKVKAK